VFTSRSSYRTVGRRTSIGADLIGQSLVAFLSKGMPMTILLTAALLGLGLAIGIPIGFAQVYGYRPLRVVCAVYEQVFRGVPALVLILLLYSGLARSFHIVLPAFTAAVFALGLRSSAYQSQIFRGAIQSVAQGQMLAARSLGMSKLQAVRHIILPQAFRLSIPPWTNEYSSVLKDTSLASAIGVFELAKQANLISTRIQYGQGARWILVIWMLVALVYLGLTYAGNAGLGLLEKRVRIPGFESKGRAER
jgi:polar amino acid transport system permease protein